MHTPFQLTLQWTRMLTPRVKHFAFSASQLPNFKFIPGQFITLYIPYQQQTLRRSYSIASIPTQTALIEFAASYVPEGKASEWLFSLQVGDCVTATGPLGQLVLQDPHPKRYVLIGTSVGITPYRSMLPSLVRLAQTGIKIVVVQGVQKRCDVLYLEDFVGVDHPYFQLLVYYSQDSLDKAKFYEKKGYVHESFAHLKLSPAQDVIYLCGNPHMVNEAFQKLQKLGFAPCAIKREKYVSPKS